MEQILSLVDSLSLVKKLYREKIMKVWKEFCDKTGDSYDDKPPGEPELMTYFKFLRNEKNQASSSLWCKYSMINTVTKNRYSFPLQKYPRITTLLKSSNTDVKKKAPVFEIEDLVNLVNHPNSSPYWIVRKVNHTN